MFAKEADHADFQLYTIFTEPFFPIPLPSAQRLHTLPILPILPMKSHRTRSIRSSVAKQSSAEIAVSCSDDDANSSVVDVARECLSWS